MLKKVKRRSSYRLKEEKRNSYSAGKRNDSLLPGPGRRVRALKKQNFGGAAKPLVAGATSIEKLHPVR